MEANFWKKKNFKTKVEKRHQKSQQPVQNQSMMMENSWVMMTHQTDKVHEGSWISSREVGQQGVKTWGPVCYSNLASAE